MYFRRGRSTPTRIFAPNAKIELIGITVNESAVQEESLATKLVEIGAAGYTSIPCSGAGRHDLETGFTNRNSQVGIEIVAPEETAKVILNDVRDSLLPSHHVTACAETVEVVRLDQFRPSKAAV